MEQASAPLLYGDPVFVYNVCGLLHLTEDVRRLKPLHSFSSFSLNNYLESLKRMVHSWSRALAEVSKRKNTQLSFSTKWTFSDAVAGACWRTRATKLSGFQRVARIHIPSASSLSWGNPATTVSSSRTTRFWWLKALSALKSIFTWMEKHSVLFRTFMPIHVAPTWLEFPWPASHPWSVQFGNLRKLEIKECDLFPGMVPALAYLFFTLQCMTEKLCLMI